MQQPTDSNLRKTLRLSTIEGLFAQIQATMAGNGSIFLTKFAQLLGATQFDYGLMTALGQLSQIFQPLGAMLTRTLTTRKPTVLLLAGLGRLVCVAFGILPFFFDAPTALVLFLVLLFVSIAAQNVAGNAWTGWMADSVPLRVRGRFFAWRSRVLMVAGFIVGLLVSAALDWATPAGESTAGKGTATPLILAVFASIFALGGIIGLIGLWILAKQPEKPKAVETESFAKLFARPFADRNFWGLLAFTVWWMFAVGIASSYWQPFMLDKLKMTLVEIQVYGVISLVSAVGTLKIWGRFIDRYGNKPAMRIAIVLGFFNPLIWVVVTDATRWIVFVEAATSGVMWAGAGLVSTNLVLAVAPKNHQQMYAGVLGAISGIAMMTSTLVSSAIHAPTTRLFGLVLQPEQTMFLIAGVARLTTQIPLFWVNEARSVSVVRAVRELTARLALRARPAPMWPRR